MNENRSLQAQLRTRPVAPRTQTTSRAEFRNAPPRFLATAHVLPVDADLGHVGNAITARIAAAKRRLLDGGLLQPVGWGDKTGEPDVRGRQTITWTMLDALIQQRPALDRSSTDTSRNDNTVLTILDPVAMTDEDTFRWGGHTHSVKAVDGLIQDEATGVRFSSEVTVIR